jgi:hypothetical protein
LKKVSWNGWKKATTKTAKTIPFGTTIAPRVGEPDGCNRGFSDGQETVFGPSATTSARVGGSNNAFTEGRMRTMIVNTPNTVPKGIIMQEMAAITRQNV